MPTGSPSSAAIYTTAVGRSVRRRIAACSDCIPGTESHSATTRVTRSNGLPGPDRPRPR